MRVGIISSVEGFNVTERQRMGELLSASSGTSIFSCPHTSVLLVLGPWDLDGNLHLVLKWPLHLDQKDSTSFPGPSALRQIMGLLSLIITQASLKAGIINICKRPKNKYFRL